MLCSHRPSRPLSFPAIRAALPRLSSPFSTNVALIGASVYRSKQVRAGYALVLDEKPKFVSASNHLGWHAAYEAALREPSKNKLFSCVEEAESAMLIRLESLYSTRRNQNERNAIGKALRNLQMIKEQILDFRAGGPGESSRLLASQFAGLKSAESDQSYTPEADQGSLRSALAAFFDAQLAPPAYCDNCGSRLTTFDWELRFEASKIFWTISVAHCLMCHSETPHLS